MKERGRSRTYCFLLEIYFRGMTEEKYIAIRPPDVVLFGEEFIVAVYKGIGKEREEQCEITSKGKQFLLEENQNGRR